MQPRPLGEDMDYSADVQVKPHVLMFQPARQAQEPEGDL